MSSAAHDIVAQALAMPTEQQQAQQQILSQLMPLRISVHDQFPPEVCLLQNDGVGFFAKGDIHAIKAKQKSGKTNAIAIMVAAILGGHWGPLTAALPDARVLVVDTEQKAADTQLIYNRTLQLAGLPQEDIYHRFQTFCLRSLSREQKIDAVKELIRTQQPDIVFIDGVVDLMANFNEVDDSKDIIEWLMQLTTPEVSGTNAAIVCVLHTNKATDDHNMRGHVGTMLAQKSGTVLEVTKRDGIFTITNTDARHKEAPQWSYCYDEHDNIVDANQRLADIMAQARQAKADANQQRFENLFRQRIAIVKKIINENGGSIHKTVLRKKLISDHQLCRSSTYSVIDKGLEQKIILENDVNIITINKLE